MTTAIPPQPTGLDLKLARVAAGITATALAAEIGVGRTAVTNAERELRPSAYRVQVYLGALERLKSDR
jgi:DNA-binding XRE family transcriptional regulator